MTILSWLLSLAAFILGACAITGLINPKVFKDEKTGAVPTRKNVFFGCGGFGLVIWIISIAVAPSKSAAPAAKSLDPLQALTETLKDTDSAVTIVTEDKVGKEKLLRIELKPPVSLDASRYFSSQTRRVEGVVKALMKNHRDYPVDRVAFTLIGELVDKYGNKSYDPLIILSFDMTELRKINYAESGFSSFALVELAEPIQYRHPIGKEVVIEYCKDEDYFQWVKNFCVHSAGTRVGEAG